MHQPHTYHSERNGYSSHRSVVFGRFWLISNGGMLPRAWPPPEEECPLVLATCQTWHGNVKSIVHDLFAVRVVVWLSPFRLRFVMAAIAKEIWLNLNRPHGPTKAFMWFTIAFSGTYAYVHHIKPARDQAAWDEMKADIERNVSSSAQFRRSAFVTLPLEGQRWIAALQCPSLGRPVQDV